MEEDVFNEGEILSSEDIIKGLKLKIEKSYEVISREVKKSYEVISREVDKAYAEVIRRVEISEFLEDFCEYHTENWVWSEMSKGGGEYLVPELASFLNLSISNTYKILESLRARRLVKRLDIRYKAISIEAYISEKRTQRRKT